MRLLILSFALFLVSTPASAVEVDFDVFFFPCERSDTQECPTDLGKIVYGSLAVTECTLGARRMSVVELGWLDNARAELRMKPYSQGNCIKLGIVPDELVNTRKKILH